MKEMKIMLTEKQLAEFCNKMFSNESNIKTVCHKPHIVIIFPFDVNLEYIKNILIDCGVKNIPVFDKEALVREQDFQYQLAVDIIDGKLVFGEFHRGSDGINKYEQKIFPIFKKGKYLDMKEFTPVSFSSTKEIDNFCKLRGKVKTKVDKNILSALILKSNRIWYRCVDKCPTCQAIEVTQEMLDKGITHFEYISETTQSEWDVQGYGTPLQVGDYILKIGRKDIMRYHLQVGHKIEDEYIIT